MKNATTNANIQTDDHEDMDTEFDRLKADLDSMAEALRIAAEKFDAWPRH